MDLAENNALLQGEHGQPEQLAVCKDLCIVPIRKRFLVANVSKPHVATSSFTLPDTRWVVGMVHLSVQSTGQDSVIAASTNTAITCWDLAKNTELQTWNTHTRPVACLHWSPLTTGRLVSATSDPAILVHDLRSAKPTVTLKGPSGAAQVKWSPRNAHYVASTHDGNVKIWDVRTPSSPMLHVTAHMSKIFSLDWCLHADEFVTTAPSAPDQVVKLWSLHAPREHMGELHIGSVCRTSITPFGRGLVTSLLPRSRAASPQDGDTMMWSLDALYSGASSSVAALGAVSPVAALPGRALFDWHAPDTANGAFDFVTWTATGLTVQPPLPSAFKAVGYTVAGLAITPAASRTPAIADSVSGPARVGAPVFGLTPASAALSPASLSPLSGPLSGSLSSPLRALQSALSASPLLAAGVEVEGDARAPIVRWQGSLSQEFRAIKTKMVPHVVFDKVDEGNRYCEITACVDGTPTLTVKIRIAFPSLYPTESPPSFEFLKYSTTLNADMQTKVKEAICARAEELVTKHMPCLRECLEVLVERLIFLQRGGDSATPPILSDATSKAHPYRLSADGTAGYPSSGENFPSTMARHSLSVLPGGMYVNMQDVAVKLTVRAGAAFTPSGVLVRFANNASAQHSRHQNRNKSFAGGRRNQHSDVNTSTVTVLDVLPLQLLSKSLGAAYVLAGPQSATSTCLSNAFAAESHKRADVARAWRLLAITLDAAVAPVPTRSGSRSSSMAYPPRIPASPTASVVWGRHPAGGHLVRSLLAHFALHGDIQTTAALAAMAVHAGVFIRGSPTHPAAAVLSMLSGTVPLLPAEGEVALASYAAVMHAWGHCALAAGLRQQLPLEQQSHRRDASVGVSGAEKNAGGFRDSTVAVTCPARLECSLCRAMVRGLAVCCLACGHGGHADHMHAWFAGNRTCAVGECACECSLDSPLLAASPAATAALITSP